MDKRSKRNRSAAAAAKKKSNVFKVAEPKAAKKAKRVQVRLKRVKESVVTKHMKLDSTLKSLHTDMVIKKNKKVAPAPSSSASSSASTSATALASASRTTRASRRGNKTDVKNVEINLKKMAV